MSLPATACRLMIIVDEDASFGHQPMHTEIVRRARDAGLAGASVFRGIEGFGRSGRVHTSRILNLAEQLPAMIIIVDSAENVERFLPQLEELDVQGVIAMDDVDIVRPGELPEVLRP